MFSTTARTEAISPTNRSEQVGWMITRGNEVVIGEFFKIEGATVGEICKMVRVGGAGNLLIETIDGLVIPILTAEPNEWIIVSGQRVVASHTFPNLGVVTTTATNIVWYGGI